MRLPIHRSSALRASTDAYGAGILRMPEGPVERAGEGRPRRARERELGGWKGRAEEREPREGWGWVSDLSDPSDMSDSPGHKQKKRTASRCGIRSSYI